MPDFNAYLNDSPLVNFMADVSQAVDVYRLIQDDPTSIVLIRDKSTTLAAQTVRIEWANTQGNIQMPQGPAGTAHIRRLVIFGVKDHPDSTIADTDIQVGDRFRLNDENYRVTNVAEYPGGVQASAERAT